MRPATVRAGLVLATLLASLIVQVPAHGVPAVANGRIAFGHRFPSGNVDIVTVLPDGSHMKRLTERHAFDTQPTYSGNGAYIAFSSDATGTPQIWKMWTSGVQKGPVTHMPVSATSPDFRFQGQGHGLVFSGDVGSGPDIYRITSGGRSLTRITSGSASDEFPAWSPNGRLIAFVRFTSATSQLCVVRRSGARLRCLTQAPGGLADGPDWSPDASRIVFAAGPSGAEDIWVIDADGSNPLQLTTDPAADFAPAWSPDGSQIAFVSRRVPRSQNVFVMNADGTGQHPITPPGSMDFAPAWQRK